MSCCDAGSMIQSCDLFTCGAPSSRRKSAAAEIIDGALDIFSLGGESPTGAESSQQEDDKKEEKKPFWSFGGK